MKQLISERTKEALSNPEIRQKISDALTGRKQSEEEIKNKTKRETDRFGLKIMDDLGNIYNSSKEAALAIGCTDSTIRKAVYGEITSAKGRKLTLLSGGRKPKDQIKVNKWIKKGRKPIENPIQDQNGIVYKNITEAHKITGVSLMAIHRNLRGEVKKSYSGFTFSRIKKVS